LSPQAGLQSSLDLFKITLGVPPEQEVRLDDSALDQFELTDPRLDTLRSQAEKLYLKLLQSEALPRTELTDAVGQLERALTQVQQVHRQAVSELGRWIDRLQRVKQKGFSGPEAEHD